MVIWMLYIDWEAAYGQSSRVKDLVFRAMRECPWSKGTSLPAPTSPQPQPPLPRLTPQRIELTNILDLAMLPFGPLSQLFDKWDMGRAYNVMMEKELRLHGEISASLIALGPQNPPIGAIELPLDQDTDSAEDE